MPKLPNPERAQVAIEKLRDYALNPLHGEGKHKARVFRAALGFASENAEQLRVLREEGKMNEELKLLDVVALLEDVPRDSLKRGEVGTVVEVFTEIPDVQAGFLVEFSDRNGEAYALASLHSHQVVKLRYRDRTREAA